MANRQEKLDALTREFQAWMSANRIASDAGDASEILASGKLDAVQHAYVREFVARWEAVAEPKWKCPNCASTAVQILLPAWHTETADGALTYVETDSEADVQGWYCDDCNDGDSGEPDKVAP